MANQKKTMRSFDRYLTVWVALSMAAGVLLGRVFPPFPHFLRRFEYAQVSLPMGILLWLMIYPMMLKVDFGALSLSAKHSKGLTITLVTNWLIKPFSMYALASLFFFVLFKSFIPLELGREYLAGAVLLGAAPCTAMVFVWSHLSQGDPGYTVVQVAVNDLVLLVAFIPIVVLLLGLNNITIPYDTLILSVVLFVLIPLGAGYLSRRLVIRRKGRDYFDKVFVKKFDKTTIGGLLLTLVIIFSFQGDTLLSNPGHIALIAVPLIIQTIIIFCIAFYWARLWKVSHSVAAPAGFIGASNFFELAVAVSVAVFGLDSGATLAAVVGVLVEVPVMLFLVGWANKSRRASAGG